jgi:hypothetical protein
MDSKFEHAALEREIKELAKEIKERGLAEKGKEAVRTVIQEQIGGPATPGASPTIPPAPASGSLPAYLDKESPEVKLKVEKLLDMALHKGIKASVGEAKNNSPLVIDAFHDALTDKLYNELKSRGLLE